MNTNLAFSQSRNWTHPRRELTISYSVCLLIIHCHQIHAHRNECQKLQVETHLVRETEVHLHPAIDVKGNHPAAHQTSVHLLQFICQLTPLQNQAEWILHRVLGLGLHVVKDSSDGLGLDGEILATLLLMANGNNQLFGKGVVAVYGWVDDIGTQGKDNVHCIDPVALGFSWCWWLQQQKTCSQYNVTCQVTHIIRGLRHGAKAMNPHQQCSRNGKYQEYKKYETWFLSQQQHAAAVQNFPSTPRSGKKKFRNVATWSVKLFSMCLISAVAAAAAASLLHSNRPTYTLHVWNHTLSQLT